MERILIGDDCEILVGPHLPPSILPDRPDRRQAVVLAQPRSVETAERVRERIVDSDTDLRVMPDGEDAKTLGTVGDTYEWLARRGFGRGDTIVAVGGGALTDAAGFVAATWMRGVEAVYVPTTLLGAVDAAIGGKTGVNVGGKNLVGAFWHPRRVVVELGALDRLPDRLKAQGAAEIIKAGLLGAPWIVAAYRRDGLAVDLSEVVPAAIRVKAGIVSEDFTERGRRALLNLGHTIGHGVEFASGISHGEAVAIGLVAAATVSERLLGFAATQETKDALRAAGLPVAAPPVDRREVLRLMGLDKKRVAGRIRMALLEAPGRPTLCEVTEEDAAAGLDAVGL